MKAPGDNGNGRKRPPASKAEYWWSVAEAAAHWKCHRQTVRAMIRRGEVEAVEGPGRARLIPDAEVCRVDRGLRTISKPAATVAVGIPRA